MTYLLFVWKNRLDKVLSHLAIDKREGKKKKGMCVNTEHPRLWLVLPLSKIVEPQIRARYKIFGRDLRAYMGNCCEGSLTKVCYHQTVHFEREMGFCLHALYKWFNLSIFLCTIQLESPSHLSTGKFVLFLLNSLLFTCHVYLLTWAHSQPETHLTHWTSWLSLSLTLSTVLLFNFSCFLK